MTSCPICNHVNPAGTVRCEKCESWLAQAADTGLKPQVRREGGSGSTVPGLTPEFAAELQSLLRDGQKIVAIARFREVTGLGLRESKEAVEALEAGRGLPTANIDARVDEAKITAILREQGLIQAIKEYRTATGLGLKEAKDAVDAIVARHGIQPARKGCLGVVLLAAISVPLAAWGLAASVAAMFG
jgi:ribosomal protein L7/L12